MLYRYTFRITIKQYTMLVRSQPISGNGGHDNYGRCEKVPVPKVKEIGD